MHISEDYFIATHRGVSDRVFCRHADYTAMANETKSSITEQHTKDAKDEKNSRAFANHEVFQLMPFRESSEDNTPLHDALIAIARVLHGQCLRMLSRIQFWACMGKRKNAVEGVVVSMSYPFSDRSFSALGIFGPKWRELVCVHAWRTYQRTAESRRSSGYDALSHTCTQIYAFKARNKLPHIRVFLLLVVGVLIDLDASIADGLVRVLLRCHSHDSGSRFTGFVCVLVRMYDNYHAPWHHSFYPDCSRVAICAASGHDMCSASIFAHVWKERQI
jgi:hypothetical protein